MKYAIFSGFAVCVLALGCGDNTLSKPDKATPPSTVQQPDNTGVNVRDRDGANKTPIDQNETRDDLKLSADIRQRVLAEKLSVDAQNVKIITQDGKVTLRGPVTSDGEKEKIEAIAKDVAGPDKVENLLDVITDK